MYDYVNIGSPFIIDAGGFGGIAFALCPLKKYCSKASE
jgi:hypothetical protein